MAKNRKEFREGSEIIALRTSPGNFNICKKYLRFCQTLLSSPYFLQKTLENQNSSTLSKSAYVSMFKAYIIPKGTKTIKQKI